MADETVQGRRLAHAITEAVAHVAQERGESVTDAIRWLAPQMNVSVKTVQRWMAGESVPDALALRPLADNLGVNVMLFVDPPAIPEYPLSDYLVRRAAAEGVSEGLRRAKRPRLVRADDEPPLP